MAGLRSIVRWFLLVVLAASVPPARGAETASGKKHALLIGVNKYDADGFSNLDFAENDAEARHDQAFIVFDVDAVGGKAKMERCLRKTPVTVRNWRTVTKLIELSTT